MLAPSLTANVPPSRRPRVVAVDLVLSSRRHSDVALHVLPGTLTGDELYVGIFLSHFTDASAIVVLELEDIFELLNGETILLDDGAVGIAHGDHDGAKLGQLARRISSHVARSGDSHFLPSDVDALGGQHVEKEIAVAVARSFRTYQRAAEIETPLGERAGELAAIFL